MPRYILVLYPDDDADFSVGSVYLEFEDDLDALAAAENVAEFFQVDVWGGEKLIAQVKKGNAPLNVTDRHSG